MVEATRFAHQHLKEVVLIGVLACANDLSLASCLVGIAVNLKKMVLQFRVQEMQDDRVTKKVVRATLPPGVQLVVR